MSSFCGRYLVVDRCLSRYPQTAETVFGLLVAGGGEAAAEGIRSSVLGGRRAPKGSVVLRFQRIREQAP